MSGGHGAEAHGGHGGHGGGGLDFIGNTFFEGFSKTGSAGVGQLFSGMVNSLLGLLGFGGGGGGGGHHGHDDHGHH